MAIDRRAQEYSAAVAVISSAAAYNDDGVDTLAQDQPTASSSEGSSQHIASQIVSSVISELFPSNDRGRSAASELPATAAHGSAPSSAGEFDALLAATDRRQAHPRAVLNFKPQLRCNHLFLPVRSTLPK